MSVVESAAGKVGRGPVGKCVGIKFAEADSTPIGSVFRLETRGMLMNTVVGKEPRIGSSIG